MSNAAERAATPSVLVVEDDRIIAEMMRSALTRAGYTVFGPAATTADALQIGRSTPPDIAVIDVDLHDRTDGLALARQLPLRLSRGVLFATAHPALVALEGRALGIACLAKPFLAFELVRAVRLVQSIATGETQPLLLPSGVSLLGDR